MLNDPRLKQAFQQYEKKQEQQYSEKIWKQKHLSREAEERILNALRKQSRRLLWKKVFIRAGEGLAVAAVFCMMAYAVYIAAHETKEPIIAGTGETETTTVTETNETTIIETGPFATETEAEFLAFQEQVLERYLEDKLVNTDLNAPAEVIKELFENSSDNISAVKFVYSKLDQEALLEKPTMKVYYRPLLLNYLYATAMDTLYEEENCVLSEEIMTLLLTEEPTYQGEYSRKDAAGTLVEISFTQYQNDLDEAEKQRELRIQKELDALRAQIQTEQSSPDFWKNLQQGDIFYLGTYEQDGLEGTRGEPIRWRVVVRNETQLLVRSSQALAAMSWTDEKKNSDHYCFAQEQFSWKDSNVRKWLNEEFYPTAFTAEEKERIALFEVKNEWGHEVYQHFNDQTLKGVGGGTTEDYCFVLGQPDLIAFTTRVYHIVYDIRNLSDAVLAQYPDVSGTFLRETRRDGWTLNVAGFNSEIDLNAVHGVVPAMVIQIPNA